MNINSIVKTDRLMALVFIGFSLFFLALTREFHQQNSGASISPAFYPRLILIAMIIGFGWLLLYSRMEPITLSTPVKLVSTQAQVLIYVFSIEPIGYFIATPLFLFLLPASLGYRHWRRLTTFATGGTLFVYIIFVRILGIPLPSGIVQ